MNFEIKLDEKDWFSYQKYLENRVSDRVKGFGFVANLFLWMFLSFVFFTAFSFVGEFDWATAIGVALIFIFIIVLMFLRSFRVRKFMAPAKDGSLYAHQSIEITEAGIKSLSLHTETFVKWDAVIGVERGLGNIMIFIDTIHALVIPESKVNNADEIFKYVSIQAKNITKRSS